MAASFSFQSFTVVQTSFISILAEASFTYTPTVPPPPTVIYPQDFEFTYTVVIGATTYTYNINTTPNFQPTLTQTTFSFYFNSVSSPFDQLFVPGIQTHTLNFNRPQEVINVNSSPVTFERISLTFTVFEIILFSDPTIRASFAYTYTGFTPQAVDFEYYLNGTLLDNGDITWNISNASGIGTGTAEFSRSGAVTGAVFVQVSSQTHEIKYQQAVIGPINSSEITTVFTLSNSNNILVTKPITTISINDYKTIILPPVASSKGTLYHFKILTVTDYNTLRIFPCLVVSPSIPPYATYLYTTSLIYDSEIEGEEGPLEFNIQNIRHTLTLVSDGANWWILNRYLGTITPGSANSLPETYTLEPTETACFRKSIGTSTNIAIRPKSYSYLKYIFLENTSEVSSITFTIYFPLGKGLDTVTGNNYKTIALSVEVGKNAALILTYSNDTYYIISAINNPAINITAEFLEEPLSITGTVNRLLNATYYYVPFISNLNSSKSTLVIIKASGSQQVKSISSSVLFQLSTTETPYATPILFSANMVIWFIVIQVSTTQYYLPVSFYTSEF